MTKQELKDSVAEVIKTNGENEITGANLQTKLFEIIDECYGGGTSSLYDQINDLDDLNLATIDGTETLPINSPGLSEAFKITLLQLKSLLSDNPYTNGIVFITESRDFEANDEGKLLVVGSESEVILTMPEGQIFQGSKTSIVFLTSGGYQNKPNGNIIYPFYKTGNFSDENSQGQFLTFLSYWDEEFLQSGLALLSSSDGFIIDPLDNTKSISIINYLMRVLSTGLQGVTDIGNSTTNSIDVIDGEDRISSMEVGAVYTQNNINNSYSVLIDDGNVLLNAASGNNAAVNFGRDSKLQEGTFTRDAGAGGISQICTVGYEKNWQAGSDYILDGSNLVRVVQYKQSTPTSSDDSTLNYKVGSIWILDNQDAYVCTDNTEANAVWVKSFLGMSPTTNDIEIIDPTKGYILRSPNNTRWRITIDDSGELVTTSL